MGFLLLFEHLFSWHVVVCNLLALCISGLFNYFFADLWVFGKKKPRPQHELLTKEELAGMSRVFHGGHRMNAEIVRSTLIPFIRELAVLG